MKRVMDITKPFVLECNALDYATGSVLSQYNDKGELHPVAFFSKTFSPAERNYNIFDKEPLAMIRSFEEWEHLLVGTKEPIQVLTDHKNLHFFQTRRNLSQWQERWLTQLSDYCFNIIYHPGTQNKKADILSRHYGLSPLEEGVTTRVLLPKELFIDAITPD